MKKRQNVQRLPAVSALGLMIVLAVIVLALLIRYAFQ
jgi:hypothetical protein